MLRTLRRLRSLAKLASLMLVGAALYKEFQQPSDQRRWHGRLFEVIPYDFRMPTLGRIKATYWNPHSPHLFSARVFGVGWTVNLYRAREKIRRLAQRRAERPPAV